MSEMYKYLEEHAYISKNKKSNYQFELSKERAEAIANKCDNLLQQKENIIKEVREYIENNSLYYQEYDYDYEENLVLGEPDDRVAKKELLEILDKENK